MYSLPHRPPSFPHQYTATAVRKTPPRHSHKRRGVLRTRDRHLVLGEAKVLTEFLRRPPEVNEQQRPPQQSTRASMRAYFRVGPSKYARVAAQVFSEVMDASPQLPVLPFQLRLLGDRHSHHYRRPQGTSPTCAFSFIRSPRRSLACSSCRSRTSLEPPTAPRDHHKLGRS